MKKYCWTGMTKDGALTGGTGESFEECQEQSAGCVQVFIGLTPADLLKGKS